MNKQPSYHIPEIRLLIANYLSTNDIACCLRINKTWYNDFLPLVWKHIHVRYDFALKTTSGPTLEALERHRHLISKLHLENVPTRKYAFHYPNLHKLYYRADVMPMSLYVPGDPNPLIRNSPIPLLNLNQSLVDVTLDVRGCGYFPDCWTYLLELPRLKKLVLSHGIIRENPDDFWRICEKLETLHMTYVEMGTSSVFDDITFPRMRDLHLELANNGVQENIVMKSPGLEKLYYSALRPPTNNAQDPRNNERPSLKKLNFRGFSGDDIVPILQGMNEATCLCLAGGDFGSLSFRAVRRHFSSLIELRLNYQSVTSLMVREILCSCPQLEYLIAECITAVDIVSSRPWACRSLKVWRIDIKFSECEQNLQKPVFERLSQLVKLRTLRLRSSFFFTLKEWAYPSLDFRLNQGLESLGSLKLLKTLDVTETTQSMGLEEAKWMIENLQSLQKFYGIKNQDRNVNREIEEIFLQHGIVKF